MALLWSVSSHAEARGGAVWLLRDLKTGTEVGALVGVQHVVSLGYSRLVPKGIESLYARSQLLVIEACEKPLIPLASLPPSLASSLGTDGVSALWTLLKARSADRSLVEQVKDEPLYPAVSGLISKISQPKKYVHEGFGIGIDLALYSRSLKAGRRTACLEGPAQVSIVLGESGSVQVLRYFEAAVNDASDVQFYAEMGELTNLLYSSDFGSISTRIEKMRDRWSSMALANELIEKPRNMIWLEALRKLRRDETGFVLIAVGVGHLVGAGNLIELLPGLGLAAELADDASREASGR